MPIYQNRMKQQLPFKLDQNILKNLSEQEKIFAEQQIQLIYAQQMAKVTHQLANLRRIQQNIKQRRGEYHQNNNRKIIQLKNKIQQHSQRRQKQFINRSKHYKNNEQKWKYRRQQIVRKNKLQNKQRNKKAWKYRDDAQLYWKTRIQSIDKKKQKIKQYQNKNHINNNQNQINNNHITQLNWNNNRSNSYTDFKNQNKFNTIHNYTYLKNSLDKKYYSEEKNKVIDDDILRHCQKSKLMKVNQEKRVFQKTMEKLDKISTLEKKRAKDLGKYSPVPTKARRVADYFSKNSKQNQKKQLQSSLGQVSKNRIAQSFKRQSYDNARNRKMLLQAEQFTKRGEIQQHIVNRMKKEKIVKQIKNKIRTIKLNTLRTQKQAMGL